MFAFDFEGQALLRAFDLVTMHSLTVIAIAFVFSLPLWPALRSRLTDAAVGARCGYRLRPMSRWS